MQDVDHIIIIIISANSSSGTYISVMHNLDF
ncbi:hypothetical protein T11_9876 [Trichinella zimbabwensis]|uniref:Uncharacterized protein n=1 Tax=Trichinella zimbabwensis TaxID=268475 RepID=A0A0V1GN60_9BILA|nr:hypothetical protein T11_8347 [Trichinella zimbabwensis]KRY63100.1 hypothetical protein T11_10174 [Trichinella zimbabwensis]KRY80142.1 hypothetical protein T11_4320 [Trichinella zimbabwensis]KRY96317.1 hypothetical protein T11_3306 [Trichinella zimbabwensis]KRY99585.1 hypothetical protein T11_15631 [Trichinella zimbabwensis]